MNRDLFFNYLLTPANYPFLVKVIIFEFLIVSFIFSFLITSPDKKSELYRILLALCQLHIKLFTLMGLTGTVAGMIDLFYATSISLDSRWMAIGLSNAIKPSLMGMLASIVTSFIYSFVVYGGNNESKA